MVKFRRRSEQPRYTEQPREQPSSEIWKACARLTTGVDYRPDTGSQANSHVRSVTWVHAPYRYMLHDYGQLGYRPTLDLRVIDPVMFRLSRLSAEITGLGLHNYTQYGIAKSGLQEVLHYKVRHPEALSEDDLQAMLSARDFVLDNGLYVPNDVDKLETEYALKQAYLDGVLVDLGD